MASGKPGAVQTDDPAVVAGAEVTKETGGEGVLLCGDRGAGRLDLLMVSSISPARSPSATR